jgi:hypothetical protein
MFHFIYTQFLDHLKLLQLITYRINFPTLILQDFIGFKGGVQTQAGILITKLYKKN